MTTKELLQHRLNYQQLIDPGLESPGEIVSWLGAVQAQDYLGSLWAIGQRLKNAREPDIEKAIADKTIVRTWPMRGTLHFAPPEDIRWMLKLLTPRVISRAAKQYRDVGLDAGTFNKSAKIFERTLRDGNRLTRNEMYEVLEKGKVSAKGLRGLHILGYTAQQGLICFGPRQGKQPTFTLLDEWLPPAKTLQRDEALAKLALKYFTSHGPATIHDFVWWSGLTVADAKRGIDAIRSELIEEIVDGISYLLSDSAIVKKKKAKTALLLPTYDEYTVAYKDRSNLAGPEVFKTMKGRADIIFTSTVVIAGRVVGVWKRTLQNNHVVIDVKPLIPLSKIQKRMIVSATKRYGKFVGLPVVPGKTWLSV